MLYLICPLCSTPINRSQKNSYECEQNHHFDLAKEGYLNLLPVNQKKSKDPGDNNLMVSARRNFLEGKWYDPMIAELKKIVESITGLNNEKVFVLDAGCGEGYYSNKVFESNLFQVWGTDISKHAIKKAAKKYKHHSYFVSSVYQLPVQNASMDLILSVFSPLAPTEFKRVLKKEGQLLVVGPGQIHMKELAETLYDEFKPHQNRIIEQLEDDFKLKKRENVTFQIRLSNNEQILDLLKMTPYFYNSSKERLDQLENHHSLEVSCDFELLVFEAVDSSTI